MTNLNFSKGFDSAGLKALLSSNITVEALHDALQVFPLLGTRKLVNPRAGRKGQSPAYQIMLPEPPIDASRETAGELLELAAMALLRDVPLGVLDSHPDAMRAAETLAQFPGLLTQPGAAGLFRYGPPDTGSRLSGLLWDDVPMGWSFAHFSTRYRDGSYGANAMAYDALQRGTVIEPQRFGEYRYPTTGRGLASLAHQDQPYLIPLFVACQLLGAGAPLSSRFPALKSEVQFITGGGPLAIQCAIASAIEPAMRDCWALKWQHMRERPERLWREGVAGRLHPDFLALGGWLVERVGDYLPMVYAEGSPIHPDWPSGHATIAGAAGGILLAHFADGPVPSLGISSVHAEIRQMMWAMSIGRNWAGIQTRSSLLAGLQLGQRHAIRHLQILRQRATEPLGRTTFTGFDGVPVTV
jgi:hypothetical protein